MSKYILILLIVPFVEIWLLLKAAIYIGATLTIAITVFTAVLGGVLAKLQASSVLSNINYSLSHGEMPANHIVEGLIVFAGSLFLVTPGFITDTLGFLFLIPYTRVFFRELAKKYLSKLIQNGSTVRFYRY